MTPSRIVPVQEVQENARIQGRKEGLAQWTAILTSTASARDAEIEKAQQDIVRLAIRIAETLVCDTLTRNPEQIGNIVKMALGHVQVPGRVTVRVNPKDKTFIVGLMDAEQKQDFERRYELVASESVEPGGCQIDTAVGGINAQLKTRIGLIEEALLQSGPDR